MHQSHVFKIDLKVNQHFQISPVIKPIHIWFSLGCMLTKKELTQDKLSQNSPPGLSRINLGQYIENEVQLK